MKNKRNLNLGIVLFTLLLCFGLAELELHYIESNMTPKLEDTLINIQKTLGKQPRTPNTASMMCGVEVTVKREGEIVERQYKENDIFTRNFAYFWLAMGKNPNQWDFKRYVDGAEQNWDAITSHQGSIKIGSGTNAPTITDYKLQTELDSLPVGSVGVSISGSEMNTTYAQTFPITQSWSINEVCLVVDSSIYEVMIARDVLGSTLNVVNGDSVTVRYLITFNGS